MQNPNQEKAPVAEEAVDDAWDEVDAQMPDMGFAEIKAELNKVLKGKRQASGSPSNSSKTKKQKAPSTAPSSAPPTRRPNTRSRPTESAPPSPYLVNTSAPSPKTFLSSQHIMSGAEPLTVTYPREVPTADALSQRAIDELSETSSRTHDLLVAEMERTSKLQQTLEELALSHNQLATDYTQLKSMVLKMSARPGEEKRGTSSIRSAKEVLANTPTLKPSQQAGSSASMPPPPKPSTIGNPIVAPVGRPRHKPS